VAAKTGKADVGARRRIRPRCLTLSKRDARVSFVCDHDGPGKCLVRAPQRKTGIPIGTGSHGAAELDSRSDHQPSDGVGKVGRPVSPETVDGYDPKNGEVPVVGFDRMSGGNTGTTPMESGTGRFLVGAKSRGRNGENADRRPIRTVLDGGQPRPRTSNGRPSENGSPRGAMPELGVNRSVPSWFSLLGQTALGSCFFVSNEKTATGEELLQQKRARKTSCWANPIASGEPRLFPSDNRASYRTGHPVEVQRAGRGTNPERRNGCRRNRNRRRNDRATSSSLGDVQQPRCTAPPSAAEATLRFCEWQLPDRGSERTKYAAFRPPHVTTISR